MIDYEYEGETFKLDDSKGCYVEVTYKGLTGYFGVNISTTGTDQHPYSVLIGGEAYATPDGLTKGEPTTSFKEARARTCERFVE